MMLAAAAIFLVALMVMIGYAMLLMPATPGALDTADAANSAVPPPPELLNSPPPPLSAAPSAAIAAPATTATPTAGTRPANATTARPAPEPPVKGAAPAPVASADAIAGERLEAARAKRIRRATNSTQPSPICGRSWSSSLVPMPRSAHRTCSAEILEKLGREDEAISAHEEFAKRHAGDSRAAASRLRTAELIARSRRPNREVVTRELLFAGDRQLSKDTAGPPGAAVEDEAGQ